MNPKAQEALEKPEKGVHLMTLGCFCSLPTSTNQRRRLKICKSAEFTSAPLCFWPFGTIST